MRATGVTTRKVDKYIQDIFTQRFCDLSIEDNREREEIIRIMKLRLESEHGFNLKTDLIINGFDGSILALTESYRLRTDA